MVPARGGISRGLNQGQSPKTEPERRRWRVSPTRTVSVRQRKAPFCDGHHIPPLDDLGSMPLFEIASAARRGRRKLLMRKFGLVAAAVVVGVGLGWIASTKARVAPPIIMSSYTIEPMKMMAGSANLPTEHFVDYSLIYP
jgi:hypothetical protein